MDFEGNFNHAIMIRTFLVKPPITFLQVQELLARMKVKCKVYNKLEH
jgi:hypothetical protein